MSSPTLTLSVYVLAATFAAIGCASVQPVDARAVGGQAQPLQHKPPSAGNASAVSPAFEGQRAAMLNLLRAIHFDFGTKLTPRQIASRLNVPVRSTEALGVWVFEPQGALFEIDANAISMDSPVDWLRVTMRAELAIHLADLTQMFSNEYDVLRGGSEFMAVEFTSNRRMYIAAELRNDRPAYIAAAPVVSVQLRRPGYDPQQRTQLGRADQARADQP